MSIPEKKSVCNATWSAEIKPVQLPPNGTKDGVPRFLKGLAMDVVLNRVRSSRAASEDTMFFSDTLLNRVLHSPVSNPAISPGADEGSMNPRLCKIPHSFTDLDDMISN
ncbi:MAG: hypothetical protein ACKPKO_65275, partial [Candidatus Fonsibacter sp.]